MPAKGNQTHEPRLKAMEHMSFSLSWESHGLREEGNITYFSMRAGSPGGMV